MELASQIFELTEEHVFRFSCFIGLSALVAVACLAIKDKTWKWFSLMTFVWVLVNLLVAILLVNHIHLPDPAIAETDPGACALLD